MEDFHILNTPSFGGQLGSALGEGLRGLVQFKIQQKLEDQERQRQQAQMEQERQRLAPLLQSLGLPQQVSGLPQDLQKAYLSDFMKQQRLGQEASALSQLFGGQPQSSQQQATPEGQALAPQEQQMQQAPDLGQILKAAPSLGLKAAPLVLQQQELQEKRKERLLAAQEKKQLEREKLQEKKQRAIESANKAPLKLLQEGEELSRQGISILDQMAALRETGKVASGLKGYLPTVAQNPETQQYIALSNDLASLLAANKGVATNFKIKFAQERKPNVTQKTETQRALEEKVRKDFQRIIKQAEIRDQLIAENDNKQPANIQTHINKRIKTENKPEVVEQQFNDNDIVQDEDTGEYFQIINGKPVPVPAERVIRGS